MRVDASYTDALAVCARCSWRSGPYVDRTAARRVLIAHTERAHGIEARAALAKTRQRDRRRTV